jgi:nicotinic acid mononucleotide adenylyltransferase
MNEDMAQTRRYHAAVALLDDCARLARLARAAADVEASDEPCAVALAGGRRLRAAMRVGVFAGSFNPLTRAHVALANAARRAAGLDALIWTCAAASVDKEQVERAALVDRLAQMSAFVAGRRREALALLNRGLYVDEARTIRALLAPSAELTLIVGYDKIVQIFDPKYYADRDAALRALFSLARLLVAPREGEGAEALAALLAQPENRPFARHVRYLDVPAGYAHDSSTEARALAAETSPDIAALTRLVPPSGLALALHTGAYRHTAPADDAPYTVRARWLDALATVPPTTARNLPPLSTLVEQTLAANDRGNRLRAWLADPHTTRQIADSKAVNALAMLPRDQASC